MDRRSFTKMVSLLAAGAYLPAMQVHAKTYLTIDQARKLLWGNEPMTEVAVKLTKDQVKAIKKASKVRVRNDKLQAWKTESGGWFIVDQVIGKHENIDLAFAYDQDGKVMGFEILTYRETYGYEVANPKWKAQFTGRDYKEHLKLDKQIKNISGATLSCRHIADGINRLSHTWEQVLRHL